MKYFYGGLYGVVVGIVIYHLLLSSQQERQIKEYIKQQDEVVNVIIVGYKNNLPHLWERSNTSGVSKLTFKDQNEAKVFVDKITNLIYEK